MSLDISLSLCFEQKCPHCGGAIPGGEYLSFNITHNLVPMWKRAGVYEALYESHGHRAKEYIYIEVLAKGVADMEANVDKYKELDSPNGWGLAVHALPWLEKVLRAFRDAPDAIISVSK